MGVEYWPIFWSNRPPSRPSLTPFTPLLSILVVRNHVLSVEDQEALRQMLPQAGAVGFVRNGALLPRMGGHSDRPMEASQAVPFQSPPNLEREVIRPFTWRRGVDIWPLPLP